MGRIQTAFNCIAFVGAAIHIAAGVVAVYYLVPRGSGMVKEEVLSRHSRSLDEIEILTAENKTKIIELGSDDSNQCFSAADCGSCVAVSRECIWFSSPHEGCYSIAPDSIFDAKKTIGEIYAAGVENVKWNSCEVPLAVYAFVGCSIGVITCILVAFLTVHFICKPSTEEQMLIEVDEAAKKEKFLKRLGRLNPLPTNEQARSPSIKV